MLLRSPGSSCYKVPLVYIDQYKWWPGQVIACRFIYSFCGMTFSSFYNGKIGRFSFSCFLHWVSPVFIFFGVLISSDVLFTSVSLPSPLVLKWSLRAGMKKVQWSAVIVRQLCAFLMIHHILKLCWYIDMRCFTAMGFGGDRVVLQDAGNGNGLATELVAWVWCRWTWGRWVATT